MIMIGTDFICPKCGNDRYIRPGTIFGEVICTCTKCGYSYSETKSKPDQMNYNERITELEHKIKSLIDINKLANGYYLASSDLIESNYKAIKELRERIDKIEKFLVI